MKPKEQKNLGMELCTNAPENDRENVNKVQTLGL